MNISFALFSPLAMMLLCLVFMAPMLAYLWLVWSFHEPGPGK